MVVMPTGSGKSLCYQLPALLRPDLTVVVSPLVALMQDQVEALEARGLGDRVALVNSQRDAGTNARSLERAAAGELRLLYVAPERFAVPGFADRLREIDVGLFVVDEAHCVSQWGHDFRPDYFRLGDAARYVGAQAIVASTATATPRVARDVEQRLRLEHPLQVSTGFDRPEPVLRGGSAGAAREAPADRGGAARARRPAGHRLCGDARRVRGARARARPGAGGGGGRLPRRPGALAPGRRAAALPGRRGAGDRGHQRVRDGRGQAQRAHGGPRERAVLAGGLLPGGGPRGPRRASRPGSAGGREPRQGAARPLHQAGGDRGRPARMAGRSPGRGGRRRRALRRRGSGAGPRAGRWGGPPAVAGRPPGARRGDRALAGSDGPGCGPLRGALRRPRRGALPFLDRRGRAGALAPVPRDLGLRGGRRLPPRGDPEPLRRSGGAPAFGALLRRRAPRRWRWPRRHPRRS